MSSPFMGEIRVVGFAFAPLGWATCDGQLLPIQQHTALFSLLQTNFGGNGISTFALPNLQGSAPMFWGQGPNLSDYTIGDSGGVQTVTLTQQTTPAHSHNPFYGDEEMSGDIVPTGDLFAGTASVAYAAPGKATFSPQAVQTLGGGQPHENMAPYQTLLYVIALNGLFPQRG